MAQLTCDICGSEFEQRSRLERHLKTSHPDRSISAADLQGTLEGIEFPKRRDQLAQIATDRDEAGVAAILRALPDPRFRDAADVSRSFGELRSHQTSVRGAQPSRRGRERGGRSGPSAASIARRLSGVRFPASDGDLKAYAESKDDEAAVAVLRQLPRGTYWSMADISSALHELIGSP